MVAKRAHDSRPGIEPGQLLPLSEFVFRARVSKTVWQSIRSRAEAGGHQLALKIGQKTFVDSTVFIDFMKASTAKKLLPTTGGAQ